LARIPILLLSPDHYSNDIKPFLNYNNFNTTISHTYKLYNIVKWPLSINTATDFLGTIDDLGMKAITQGQAEILFRRLNILIHVLNVVKALTALVSKLPCVAFKEKLPNHGLSTSIAKYRF
jgi:hypothetical protein